MKKTAPSQYQYRYPYRAEQFLADCRARCDGSDKDSAYLFEHIDDTHMRIGIGRGGHGGYWYEASLSDTADGHTAVDGRIRYYTSGGICSEDVPYTRREKVKDTIRIVLLFFLLWPIVLPIWLFFWIVEKASKNKPMPPPRRWIT